MPKPQFRVPLRRFLLLPLAVLILLPAGAGADVTVRFKNDIKQNAMTPSTAQQGSINPKSLLPAVASIQIKGGKAYTDSGSVGVLVNFATQEVTLIDPAHKQFATTYLKDYLDELSASMPAVPAMPAGMQQIMDSMKTNFSSRKTGRTDMVLGVLVEENELTLSVDMPVPVPPGTGAQGASPQAGQPMTLMRMVMDIWAPAPSEIERVPALGEWNKSRTSSAAALLDPFNGMQKLLSNLPGFGKSLAPAMEGLTKNPILLLRGRTEVYIPIMARLAPLLRAQGKLPADFDPNAPLLQIDTEAVELSGAAIDDSAFQVPGDYHSTPLADLMKSVMPRPNVAPTSPAVH